MLLGPVVFRRTGICLLGLPAPAGAVRLPHGRPTEPGSDPIGVATLPAREIRPGWVLSILRGYGAHTAGAGNPAAAGRLATAHPWTWVPLPPPQAWHNGASSRVHSRSPVRSSPLPVASGWNGSPWALPPGFTPRRYRRRMPEWGQASGTCPRSRHRHQPALLSTRPLITRTFVSHACRAIIRNPSRPHPAHPRQPSPGGRSAAPAGLPRHDQRPARPPWPTPPAGRDPGHSRCSGAGRRAIDGRDRRVGCGCSAAGPGGAWRPP